VVVSFAGSVAGRLLLVRLLQEPAYRRLWASGLCMNVARWMDLVTLGWLALQFTGSPFMVGVAAFARAAPLMVVGPFTGIVADRVPRGRILLVAQSVGMATALALAAIFWNDRGGYASLVALEVVFGVVWALDFPARRTALYAVLGTGRVAQAVSLETVSMQIAKVVGPLAAGACLARQGPAVDFALMALVYGVGLAATSGLRDQLGGPRVAPPTSVGRSFRSGLQAAWRSPTVRAVLFVTVAMNTLFFPYQHMLPVFARDVLALGPGGLGALVAADGCGALLGGLAFATRRGELGHRILFGVAVMAAPTLLVALSVSRRLTVCVVLLVAMGVAESAFATMQSTLVLLESPEPVRGGAMGILSACIGTQPLGTLAIGLLAASMGTPLAFTVNALAALLVIVPLAVPLVQRAGPP
jgi:MFS family permease